MSTTVREVWRAAYQNARALNLGTLCFGNSPRIAQAAMGAESYRGEAPHYTAREFKRYGYYRDGSKRL